jgi:hypothetical protein
MAYESFYEGTPYTLEPVYHAPAGYGDTFIGHRMPFKRIGAPTSVQTANQIQEVTNLLNQGIRHVELQPLNPEIFDTIPKQHFKEIARIQKLAGAETSIHAPVIEPSGIGREGWSEEERLQAENQLKGIIDKAQDLNPNGFMPIVIHASAIQGSEESPVSDELKKSYIDNYKKNHGGEAPSKERLDGLKYKRIVAINQETKQMIPIEREEKIYPGMQEPKIYTPEEQVEIHNHSQWDNKLSQLVFYKDRGHEVFERSYPIVAPEMAQFLSKQISEEELKKRINADPQKKAAYNQVQNAMVYLENTDLELNSLFNQAWMYSNKEDREELNKLSREYKEKMTQFHQRGKVMDIGMKSELQQDLIESLRTLQPQVFVPIEKFTKEKSSETFANVAWHAYNHNKKNPPVIAIENLFPGMAFSRSEELKQLIEETRKKFENQAVKNGYSRDEAKKIGEKVIGATWDVGHLNMQRKSGFEEKDLIAESKNIAPFVKHVHLTDNFGYNDSHLPPGMGNVPFKGILEELEKKGFKGKGVVEAGNFAAQFKISPTPATLEALGSPLYAMGQAPYWNQMPAIAHGDYFSGYGPIFPEQHFSMYGTGFSGMPTELGGQVQGKQSRFSGAPNE